LLSPDALDNLDALDIPVSFGAPLSRDAPADSRALGLALRASSLAAGGGKRTAKLALLKYYKTSN
jgi:hypothetical protein